MLNEEQKKQIRQMAAGGVGYRETMKVVFVLNSLELFVFDNEKGCDP